MKSQKFSIMHEAQIIRSRTRLEKRLLSSQEFWKWSLEETPLIIFTLGGTSRLGSLCSARLSGTGSGSLAWRMTRTGTPRWGSEELWAKSCYRSGPPHPSMLKRMLSGNLSRILCSGCNTWTVLLSNPFVSVRVIPDFLFSI